MYSICFYLCMYLHANHGFMIHVFWMEFSSLSMCWDSDLILTVVGPCMISSKDPCFCCTGIPLWKKHRNEVQVIINGNTVATLQASIQDFPTSVVLIKCSLVSQKVSCVHWYVQNQTQSLLYSRNSLCLSGGFIEFAFSFSWFVVHQVWSQKGTKEQKASTSQNMHLFKRKEAGWCSTDIRNNHIPK